MEFGQILRAMLANRTRYVLIALEVALTLAIVVNCVHMAGDMYAKMTEDSGIDEEHVIAVQIEPFTEAYLDEDFLNTQIREDLRLLRELPGVKAAAGITYFPLGQSGSSTSRRPLGSEIDGPTLPFFWVTEGALDTLGLELVAGRDFIEEDFELAAREPEGDEPTRLPMILSQEMADRLFPEGDAVGQQLTDSHDSSIDTVVGVVRRLANAWPQASIAGRTALIPGRHPGNRERYRFVVRSEAGGRDELFARVEPALYERDAGRVITVTTLGELRSRTFEVEQAVLKMIVGLVALLLFVTVLGVVGLTSFSVTQRRHQIGTRRALGATRPEIVRYFLTENWMVTTLGAALGIALSFGLNVALQNLADGSRLGWPLVLYGVLFLWLAGLGSSLVPALRGARVSPVEATRRI